MSSSRPAQKLVTTISTFQKLRLRNKYANERPRSKYLPWLPFGWTRARLLDLDGPSNTFNSTGIVADSIFMVAQPGAASVHQEKLIASCESSPEECMIEQPTSRLQSEPNDLARQLQLPAESKQAKGSLIGASKHSVKHQKPTFDFFRAAAEKNYSHVKTHESLQSKEHVRSKSYWVRAEDYPSTKTAKGAESALDLQSLPSYCMKAVSDKSSQVMRSRVSLRASLSSPFNTLKRLYSAKKGSTDKPPKPRKKDGEPKDWLNSKSPNECKKNRGKCDPDIKPFKSAGPSPPSPVTCLSSPMTPRVTEPGPLSMPFNTHRRYYSDKKEAQAQDSKADECPPEEEAKEAEVPVETHRCAKAKCGPESVPCAKPPPINQYRCPTKKVAAGRKKKRAKPDAKKEK